jgi:hypothetical protein
VWTPSISWVTRFQQHPRDRARLRGDDPDDLGPTHANASDLRDVVDAGTRGAALCRQLLAFSRNQPNVPRVVALRDAIESIRPMLDRLTGRGVDPRLDLETCPMQIRIDPTQLDQILMNLVVNARDAMPRDGGAHRARCARLDRSRECAGTGDDVPDPSPPGGVGDPGGRCVASRRQRLAHSMGAGLDEASRTSRTFRNKAAGVMGFCKNAVPVSSMP